MEFYYEVELTDHQGLFTEEQVGEIANIFADFADPNISTLRDNRTIIISSDSNECSFDSEARDEFVEKVWKYLKRYVEIFINEEIKEWVSGDNDRYDEEDYSKKIDKFHKRKERMRE